MRKYEKAASDLLMYAAELTAVHGYTPDTMYAVNEDDDVVYNSQYAVKFGPYGAITKAATAMSLEGVYSKGTVWAATALAKHLLRHETSLRGYGIFGIRTQRMAVSSLRAAAALAGKTGTTQAALLDLV
jgi:hypothetical protein